MAFVADVIPDELLRITEFPNGQMNTAKVVAVEVKLKYDGSAARRRHRGRVGFGVLLLAD